MFVTEELLLLDFFHNFLNEVTAEKVAFGLEAGPSGFKESVEKRLVALESLRTPFCTSSVIPE